MEWLEVESDVLRDLLVLTKMVESGNNRVWSTQVWGFSEGPCRFRGDYWLKVNRKQILRNDEVRNHRNSLPQLFRSAFVPGPGTPFNGTEISHNRILKYSTLLAKYQELKYDLVWSTIIKKTLKHFER